MGTPDKALGAVMLLVAAFVFVYYTTWAILLPLFPADHTLQSLFPPREWAVRLPAFILCVGLTAIGSFIAMVMVKEGRKQRQKLLARQA
ncbi:Dolichol phosphate-mannose biosynthesis regulatory protein OS=Dictyostelium discoideum GN=dpm2-1 PE=3 SV=1 [Rhizoctonia solani AG-1 IB]|uniref:Dolichol phosphate-mannose biosynthesis regulatory protein n=1 Tax=Thanatephorus cucumeris (strain AG1-IB / isolate 7/3/14) TaxID=1108050 RepID=A0A0B7F3Z0_THACB|nr:Dolichol phosphate-mannose biosynthesis regulatory protein OS=Dictyostelium discoideum GN=dpm2-1 PE=3 SV=1 [Rhizoctonia solani AG-1 IB]